MSILKAILHRWNKNTKTYDTIHPETETSQITDFNSAVDGKISTHNNSNTAHSALFGKKVNVAGDAMTGNLNLKGAALQFTRTDDNTTNGKDYLFDPINISGSDGNRYGFMRVIKKSSGSRQLQLGNVDNNNNPSGSISINTDNNGTAINVQGITPSDGANDTSLTTAEWVNKKLGNYEKTGSLANDIITKLAQTTVMSIISTLQTGSWFGQLLKLVLNASGVKYLIGTNGYICFGSFFGGLIIQWESVEFNQNTDTTVFIYPCAYKYGAYAALLTHMNTENTGVSFSAVNLDNKNQCTLYGDHKFYSTTKFFVFSVGI